MTQQVLLIQGTPAASPSEDRRFEGLRKPAVSEESERTIPFSPEASSVASVQAAQDSGKLQEVVNSLNDFVQSISRKLHFSIDEATGKTVIRVTDPDTDELIRQIPPEEILRLSESLDDPGGEETSPGLLLRIQV